MTGTQTLPQSAVPAALDRGHLYSPTLDLTRYALEPCVGYDYRPGLWSDASRVVQTYVTRRNANGQWY